MIRPSAVTAFPGYRIRVSYPDGVEGGFFYEKRCPSHRPEWVQTATVWSERHDSEINYCLANDLPSIVWAANLGDLELHTFLAKQQDVERPTMVVFDLDPGPPANILQCAQVAQWLKEELDALDLQSFPKTSGSKGLQIYIPLNTSVTYDVTKPFARTMAERLTRDHPDLVTAKMEKRLRTGKVFVDWSQNDEHKTTIAVYSLRARERPTVSTPVTWEEVERSLKKKDASLLVFEAPKVVARFEKVGDLFEPVLKLKQKLPTLKELMGAEPEARSAAEPERIEIAAQADDPPPLPKKGPKKILKKAPQKTAKKASNLKPPARKVRRSV